MANLRNGKSVSTQHFLDLGNFVLCTVASIPHERYLFIRAPSCSTLRSIRFFWYISIAGSLKKCTMAENCELRLHCPLEYALYHQINVKRYDVER